MSLIECRGYISRGTLRIWNETWDTTASELEQGWAANNTRKEACKWVTPPFFAEVEAGIRFTREPQRRARFSPLFGLGYNLKPDQGVKAPEDDGFTSLEKRMLDTVRQEEKDRRLGASFSAGPASFLRGIRLSQLSHPKVFVASTPSGSSWVEGFLAKQKAAERIFIEHMDPFSHHTDALGYLFSVNPYKDIMDTTPPLVPVPHAELRVEYARQMAYGETRAGWWQWEFKNKGHDWADCRVPANWNPDSEYRFDKADKHPKYVAPKPKLKLIDMAKLPKGSVVSGTKYFDEAVVVGPHPGNHLKTLILDQHQLRIDGCNYLSIAEQKEFTYWGGGKCPVPDGLIVEVVHREYFGSNDLDQCKERFCVGPNSSDWAHLGSRRDIIAYRIIGVAEGWTDNPELAK